MSSSPVELFVRAGRDNKMLGGCPQCQRVFLALSVKSEYGPLTLSVTTVNPAKPPTELRGAFSRLPAIRHDGEMLTDVDEMLQYIDKLFPQPSLAYDCDAATEACQDIFSRFSYFIKDVSHTPASLMTELRRLDAYLVSSGRRYLCSDDHPTHLDCIMLPKLQHIRVAAGALRQFQIPADLRGLWRYLEAAYQSDLFFKTCPADEEIVAHWLEKPECRAVVDEATLLSAARDRPPTYSFDVPPPPAP